MSVKPDTPITRKEMYLDAATGGSSTLPEPVTIEEKYLAKIAGMTVDLPAPVPLKHKFLAKIAGMQVDVPTYTTGLPRIYAYLAKAAGQDVEVPQPITREEMYWFDYVSGQPTPSEREYTGAVPVTFTADGTPLLDYLISGKTVQTGTPTPDNQIMPEGCGDLETVGEKAGQYKIPISSASTTTPVYLGEVQTTRKIRKIKLEVPSAVKSVTGGYQLRFGIYPYNAINYTEARSYCNIAEWDGNNARQGHVASGSNVYITQPIEEWSTVESATEWLSQHDVFVWYVLATEQTGIVNEPLMKIGDYADTLSMDQAGVSVPTVAGSNTLDVLTLVKPSEVYIKYIGEPVSQMSMLLSRNTDEPEELSEETEEIPEEVPEEKEEETESITPETTKE